MSRRSTFKTRLRSGAPVLGTYCFLPSVDAAEIAAVAGLDFIVVDLEHSPKDWEVVANMVRAGQLGGAAVLVRIARNTETDVLQVLELGADGIVVPFVRDAEDVRRAMASSLYPPLGVRGTCGMTRHSSYGLAVTDFARLTERANREVVVIGQVEDPSGVEHLDEILACDPGLDAVLVGRGDLAASLGLPSSTGPEMAEVVRGLLARRPTNGPAFALFTLSPREVEEWYPLGVTVFAHLTDTAILSRAFRKARTHYDAVTTGRT